MKSRLPLVIGLFFLCLCLTPSQAVHAQDLGDPSEQAPTDNEPSASFILSYDSQAPVLLGNGYNSVSQSTTGEDCIFDATTTPVVGPCQEHTYFHYVNSTEELAQTLGLNMGASMNMGLYSGSVSASALSEHQVSESTLTAVAMMEIKCGAAKIAEPRLSDGITGQNFFAVCGDYYADSVTVGGKLYAVISIQTSSQSDHKQIKADLNISATGKGSGSVSFSDDMTSKLSKYNADVDVYTVGCRVYEPVTNFQGFLDLLKTFKDDIQSCVTTKTSSMQTADTVSAADAMKLASDVRFTSIIPALNRKYGGQVEDVTPQRDAMYTMMAWRAAYKALEVDIDTIRARPDLYQIPQDQIDAQLQSLAALKQNVQETYLPTVEKRINHCALYPNKCALLTDGELAEKDRPVSIWHGLPQPNDFYPQDCNGVQRIFGDVQGDADYVVYLNGNPQNGYLARCRFGYPGDAKTYLNLPNQSTMKNGQDPHNNSGLTSNYSSFINYYISGDHVWPDLVTMWNKVRIVPQGSQVYIDPSDTTYATTFYYPSREDRAWPLGSKCHLAINDLWFAPYGSAVGGNNGRRYLSGMPGTANIDLSGTPFVLADDQTFHTFSRANLFQVIYGPERRSVQINVGGNNGYGSPSGTNIYLKGAGAWINSPD